MVTLSATRPTGPADVTGTVGSLLGLWSCLGDDA